MLYILYKVLLIGALVVFARIIAGLNEAAFKRLAAGASKCVIRLALGSSPQADELISEVTIRSMEGATPEETLGHAWAGVKSSFSNIPLSVGVFRGALMIESVVAVLLAAQWKDNPSYFIGHLLLSPSMVIVGLDPTCRKTTRTWTRRLSLLLPPTGLVALGLLTHEDLSGAPAWLDTVVPILGAAAPLVLARSYRLPATARLTAWLVTAAMATWTAVCDIRIGLNANAVHSFGVESGNAHLLSAAVLLVMTTSIIAALRVCPNALIADVKVRNN